ncbi:MAG: glutamine-hydrolyzing carbamoyl-phosphate synthase small subunit [Vulcanimicrobiaceae bacterium]
MHKRAALLLADGTRFEGAGLGPAGTSFGEAVFYTGMTGYEEALTDPSYAGQLLVFTYPMIGNYGISGRDAQHPRPCVAGAVIKRLAERPSHAFARESLGAWLEREGVRTLLGIDTRALVTTLREHGTLAGAIALGEASLVSAERELATYARTATTRGLVPSVALADETAAQLGAGGEGPRIVLLDCGVKRAIVRELRALGARVLLLPYGASAAQILALEPAALVISPGPGDPTDLPATIETLRGLLGRLPMFGICLGHQLLALACGARTYKLPYGHRGGNQPVKDLRAGRVLVTAHNHGYAVDGDSLPAELEATLVNLNDGTNEGFRHRRLPIAAVQFHPEASPGPYDARGLFAEWFASLAA